MERGNALFYECIEDAIKDDINAIGGPKKAAEIFFPDKTVDQGAAYLRAWGLADRSERPGPSQYILLKEKAKEVGSFACVRYEEQRLSCKVTWVEPEEELTVLLREYIASRKSEHRAESKIESLISKLRPDMRAAK